MPMPTNDVSQKTIYYDLTTDHNKRALEIRTASMLDLAHIACSIRRCRRDNRCSRFIPSTGEFLCYWNLDAAQKAKFDQILQNIYAAGARLKPGVLAGWVDSGEAGSLTNRERGILEIIRATLPANDVRISEFKKFWRTFPGEIMTNAAPR